MTVSTDLDRMIEALVIEVEKIRSKRTPTSSSFVAEFRSAVPAQIPCTPFHSPKTSTSDMTPPWVVGQAEVSGTIVSCKDGTIVVALEEDVGPKIPFASLVTDDSFLLDRLREKLIEVRDSKVSFN